MRFAAVIALALVGCGDVDINASAEKPTSEDDGNEIDTAEEEEKTDKAPDEKVDDSPSADVVVAKLVTPAKVLEANGNVVGERTETGEIFLKLPATIGGTYKVELTDGKFVQPAKGPICYFIDSTDCSDSICWADPDAAAVYASESAMMAPQGRVYTLTGSLHSDPSAFQSELQEGVCQQVRRPKVTVRADKRFQKLGRITYQVPFQIEE